MSPLDELRNYSLLQILLAIVGFIVVGVMWIEFYKWVDNAAASNVTLLVAGAAIYCWWKG